MKRTREEKQAILKATSERIKAGDTSNAIIAVSVTEKPYSVFNQCFLANQQATPGVFGGFQQWRGVGRQVKKGEHGYSIVFPMQRNGKNDEGAKVEDEHPHFAMVTVFHFDQTEPMKEKDKDPELTNALNMGAITD